jgi:two-component system sensor histidine kinase/response regulator
MRPLRFDIRMKVLLLALVLAWPPLIGASWLGLSALDQARDSAVQAASDALRAQAEANLAKRASDKARLYNTTLRGIQQQIEGVAAYTRMVMDAGPAPTNLSGRVWISPDGPSSAAERAHAGAVARARQLTPYLGTVVRTNPLINLGYIGLEDGGVIAFDHDIVDRLLESRPFDVRRRPWYIAAREAGRTVWVDTYIDANSKMPVVTCATPIYDTHGQFVGVVGFDILLDTFQDDILRLDLGTGGYAFLLNSKGLVIARPEMHSARATWDEPFETENLLQTYDPALRQVVERMVRREQGVENITYEHTGIYLAYAPIESSGWSVGMVIPQEEIERAAAEVGTGIAERQARLRTQVLWLVAMGLIAVPVLGALLTLLIARPLRHLQAGAQRIAAGELSHQIDITSNDELGDLGRSFNAMTTALRDKVAELEENVRQISVLYDVSNRFKAILSLPQLLDAIPRAVCRDFGFDRAALYLVDGRHLRAVSASFGDGADEQAAEFLAVANAEHILIDGDSVEADVIRSGQAVIVSNPWNQPRVLLAKQQVSRSESYVQVPIYGREGRVIGLLSADCYYQRRAISARDAAQLLTFASMVGLTIENTRLTNDLGRQVAQRTAELREALERAREADRLKGQFLAAVSHELRTPLNAIIGFSTVLLDELDGPITPMQAEDLRTINQNGRFLLHMINELLDLSRIEAGKLELAPEPTDIGRLIAEVAETTQGLLYGKPVTLRVVLPPRLPAIMVDQAKVRQIILNLLSNAVKFTEQGEITVAARCVALADDAAGTANGQHGPAANGARRTAPYLAVSVSDTGIGIAPEHLPLIFEEFRQVHAERSDSRGSGLGLAITRRLVEAHHGRIWVESVPGQGSTFTFILPLELVPGQAPNASRPPPGGERQAGAAERVAGEQHEAAVAIHAGE